MPVVPTIQGSRIAYVVQDYPPECDLSAMPKTSALSAAEYSADVTLFKSGQERWEVSLHRRYCTNAACPGRWAPT